MAARDSARQPSANSQRAGAKVAILDLPSSPGAKVAESLGANALFVEADVASADQVTDAIAKTVAKFCLDSYRGELRGHRSRTAHDQQRRPSLIRIIQQSGPGKSDRDVQRNFDLAAAQMAKNATNADGERGVIINTASIAAFDGQIGQAAYSASKGGVVGMTLPIARDLASSQIGCL